FACLLPLPEVGVELLQHDLGVVVRAEREVGPAHAELVVGVQVVRRRQQGADAGEALFAQPDDLLLAAHLAVVARVAAGTLGDRQLVLDHPREVPGGDARRPLAPHDASSRGTSSPTRRAAWTTGATSWTRTIAAPCVIAHTAVASVGSRRSSTAAPPVRSPRNPFRLVPTKSGSPMAVKRRRCRRSERLCSRVLPKPIPGSIHTSPTPAARAAAARSASTPATSATTPP